MTIPKAIFFDLDDTLIRYDDAYEIALTASHELVSRRHPHVSRADLRKAVFASYEKLFGYRTQGFADAGTLSVQAMRERLTGDALRALDADDSPGFVAELIAAHEAVEAREITVFADTHPTLDILGTHFRLGVITNGPSAMQRAKLVAADLAPRFPVIVVDSEFGHPKPDARIFAHAAQAVGFAPDEMLFVGNSPEADVAGAVGAGWTSVWVNASGACLPAGVPAPHHVIKSLGELPELPPISAVIAATRGTIR